MLQYATFLALLIVGVPVDVALAMDEAEAEELFRMWRQLLSPGLDGITGKPN